MRGERVNNGNELRRIEGRREGQREGEKDREEERRTKMGREGEGEMEKD